MIWYKIIPSKEYLGNTPVFNIIPKNEPSSGNPVDYLTKLLCGRVSAQFLPDYLCQLKTKKHKQNAAKYWKNGGEIFSLSAVLITHYIGPNRLLIFPLL